MSAIPEVILPDMDLRRGPSVPSLMDWVISNRNELDNQILNSGAILFRGFEVQSADDFRELTTVLAVDFLTYERGATPRKKVKGNVYTSTEASRRIPIPLHCEMSSYGTSAPSRIIFFCEHPAKRQGQTPIADMAAMYDELDSGVRNRFHSRGLRMIQNVPEKLSLKTMGATKTWMQMFETDDREKVDDYCRQQEIQSRWKPDGTVQLINYCDPIITHPRSGRSIWFNSAHNFFPSWSWEMRRVKSRMATALFSFAENRMVKTHAPEDRPYYVTFADGGEIDPRDIIHIRESYWKHARLFDWQRGDVLLLDNLWFAHGRMPYSGYRRVLAVIADPWQKIPARLSA